MLDQLFVFCYNDFNRFGSKYDREREVSTWQKDIAKEFETAS